MLGRMLACRDMQALWYKSEVTLLLAVRPITQWKTDQQLKSVFSITSGRTLDSLSVRLSSPQISPALNSSVTMATMLVAAPQSPSDFVRVGGDMNITAKQIKLDSQKLATLVAKGEKVMVSCLHNTVPHSLCKAQLLLSFAPNVTG